MDSQPDPDIQIAGYRIEARLGRGGMGEVYRAVQLSLDRRVALKVLAPKLAADDVFRRRFLRESRIAASIDHPSIIPIYETGEDGGLLYIAMRYVDGMDLATLLRRDGRLAPARVLAIMTQVASALDAAHARGLVHRDVKPGNILLAAAPDGTDGHCYLCDFGLIKQVDTQQAQSALTATDQFVGTIPYVSPEQIEGRALDGRADVYSLGCVVFQCLTGSVPFERMNDIEVVFAHMREPPPAVSARVPGLPPSVDAIVARAMAKSRSDRWPTCSALVAALSAELQHTPTRPPASSADADTRSMVMPPPARPRSAPPGGAAGPGAAGPGAAAPAAGPAAGTAASSGVAAPAGSPGAEAPGAGSPGMASPAAGSPGVANPGTAAPGVASPAASPGAASAGAASAGAASAGAAPPAAMAPGAAGAEADPRTEPIARRPGPPPPPGPAPPPRPDAGSPPWPDAGSPPWFGAGAPDPAAGRTERARPASGPPEGERSGTGGGVPAAVHRGREDEGTGPPAYGAGAPGAGTAYGGDGPEAGSPAYGGGGAGAGTVAVPREGEDRRRARWGRRWLLAAAAVVLPVGAYFGTMQLLSEEEPQVAAAPTTTVAPTRPPAPTCPGRVTRPEVGDPNRTPPLAAIRAHMGWSDQFLIDEIRTWRSSGGNRRWYVKARQEGNQSRRGRWLVEQTGDNQPVVLATAPFGTRGYAAKDWEVADGQKAPTRVAGCLTGT